jgi:hypothetical protein
MSEPDYSRVSFRRKFNLGNYETMDIELECIVHEGDDVMDLLKRMDKTTEKYKDYRRELNG